MPLRKLTLAALMAFGLAGCPTPPPSTGGDQPGQPGQPGPPPGGEGQPPPGGEGQPPPPGEGQPPPGENAPPPGEGQPGEPGVKPEDLAGEGPLSRAPSHDSLSSFDELIGDGPHINVTVNVKGATSGQVDFQTFVEHEGQKQPKVLHVQRFSGSSLTVKAPANYSEPVYIAVNGFEGEEDLSTQRDHILLGGVDDAVTFGETDIVLDVTMGTPPEWMGAPSAAVDTPPLSGPVPPPSEP